MQFFMDPHHQPPPPPPHPQPQAQPQPLAPPPSQVAQLPILSQPPPSLLQQQGQAPPAPGGSAATVPQIQFNQAANPTPNLVAVPVSNHPPYAQMITEAITALKEKEGSSKRAIAKYIERVYANANLPGTHSALLTNHLKRLKEQGNIVMVKHSYKLPNSRSPPVGPSPPPNPTSNGPKRRPGRPPKAKNAATAPSSAQFAQGAQVDPAAPAPLTNPGHNTDPVSVFASLGLADGPVPVPVSVSTASPLGKRRPGRPKKSESGGAAAALKPNLTLGKKTPGRPRKVAAKNAINAAVNAAGLAGSVIVSPRGQPRLKADGTPAKPRGRPPKKNMPVTTSNASVPAVTGGFLAPAVYVGEGAMSTTTSPTAKRRGRPPSKALNGPKMPRKLSGKPLGRPRKITPLTGVPGLAYDELRRKLDLFQSKIKQTVNVVKPCLDGNAGTTGALSALRDLEELANLELGPPASIPVQQPPPQS